MSVFINNVDDYLGPSQACVNPLFLPDKPTQSDTKLESGYNKITSTKNGVHASAEVADSSRKVVQNRRRMRQRRAPRIIQSEDDGNTPNTGKIGDPIRLANEKDNIDVSHDDTTLPATTTNAAATTQVIKKKAKATLTLSDCLSCSGCVTSAEAVLMSHHSIDKLREVSQKNSQDNNQRSRRIVFTISSASLADLYRHLYLRDERNDEIMGPTATDTNVPPSRHDFLSKVAAFLHSEFGAEMVIDGAISQRISLMESASEFCYRYRQSQQSAGSKQTCAVVVPSVALSSAKTRYINKQPNNDNGVADEDTLMEITTLRHPPGVVIEEEDDRDELTAGSKIKSPQMQPTSLPMLASSCPGFVCLVEKTAPLAVPLLSSVKSPMAVAGILVKTGQPNRKASLDIDPMASESVLDSVRSCYHVAIMPCYDKKLEAGRGDLTWEKQALLRYGYGKSSLRAVKGVPITSISVDGLNDAETEDTVNEVDLVITTGELLEILSEAAETLKCAESSTQTEQMASESESVPSSSNAIRNLLARENPINGSCAIKTATDGVNCKRTTSGLELDTGVHGSGSYADFIFRYAAQELFGCKLPHDEPLPWKGSSATYAGNSAAGKSAGVLRRRKRRQESTDLREVVLYKHSDGSYSCSGNATEDTCSVPVLRFGTAYGFKNVQLILQSLSKTDTGYDYVEIMACPSGCSNGGGQIGANGQRETPRDSKERVRKTVSTVPIVRPTDGCKSLVTALCGCDNQGFVQDSILHGEYFDKSARQLLHTGFHIVPKLELSTGATAGVAVSDTKW